MDLKKKIKIPGFIHVHLFNYVWFKLHHKYTQKW